MLVLIGRFRKRNDQAIDPLLFHRFYHPYLPFRIIMTLPEKNRVFMFHGSGLYTADGFGKKFLLYIGQYHPDSETLLLLKENGFGIRFVVQFLSQLLHLCLGSQAYPRMIAQGP